MSNKTDLQANNVDLASILSTVQELPLYEPPEGQYAWKKYTDSTKETFVDYVVDDSPTAYPDGGLQDGYWYEKILNVNVLVDFTYTGTYTIEYPIVHDENNNAYQNWILKLLTSGIFNLKETMTPIIDVFTVGGGGGGGGATSSIYGGGGGGGYTNLQLDVDIEKNTDHIIVVGAGGSEGANGAGNGGNGGTTSCFSSTCDASGGFGSYMGIDNSLHGGDGGSGGGGGGITNNWQGGTGGSDGSDGTGGGTASNLNNGGSGSGVSTYFQDILYSGGGGGGGYGSYLKPGPGPGGAGGGGAGGRGSSVGGAGIVNTGGGGGGAGVREDSSKNAHGGAGGSGIVIIVGRYA